MCLIRATFLISFCHSTSHFGYCLKVVISLIAQALSLSASHISFWNLRAVVTLSFTFYSAQSHSFIPLNGSRYSFSMFWIMCCQLLLDNYTLISSILWHNVSCIHSAITKLVTTVQKKSLLAWKSFAFLAASLRAKTIWKRASNTLLVFWPQIASETGNYSTQLPFNWWLKTVVFVAIKCLSTKTERRRKKKIERWELLLWGVKSLALH